uniref:Transposase n=1 Tax=Steinernema glaseri TaxID=37863 RepID=A0A1I7ZDV8_9BILA
MALLGLYHVLSDEHKLCISLDVSSNLPKPKTKGYGRRYQPGYKTGNNRAIPSQTLKPYGAINAAVKKQTARKGAESS